MPTSGFSGFMAKMSFMIVQSKILIFTVQISNNGFNLRTECNFSLVSQVKKIKESNNIWGKKKSVK